MRTAFAALALLTASSLPVMAADQVATASPSGAYKKVSELVKLPDFLPGPGQLYVDPKTLPAGPFLAYDRDGLLVSTVYMLPTEDLPNKDKRFDGPAAPGGAVGQVDVSFDAGHPGVEKPHAHIVLWHGPEADEARVAGKQSRREVLRIAGDLLAGLAWPRPLLAQEPVEIRMRADHRRATDRPPSGIGRDKGRGAGP
jgi:hypothetical protein